MINQVVLVGRLTKEVNLKYTPSNQAVATFSLAVNVISKVRTESVKLILSTV